jgi:voltage-gated sodium channel
MYINMYGCDNYGYDSQWNKHMCTKPKMNQELAVLYFVTFVIISSLVMMSLFIGVVTNSMTEAVKIHS